MSPCVGSYIYMYIFCKQCPSSLNKKLYVDVCPGHIPNFWWWWINIGAMTISNKVPFHGQLPPFIAYPHIIELLCPFQYFWWRRCAFGIIRPISFPRPDI